MKCYECASRVESRLSRRWERVFTFMEEKLEFERRHLLVSGVKYFAHIACVLSVEMFITSMHVFSSM